MTHRRPFSPTVFVLGGLVGLSALTALAAPDNAGRTAGSERLAGAVGSAIAQLQAVQREMAAEPLDEDGVIDRVGADPAKLCQWVRTRIAYERYRGFLKGASGALISGRANSADKSLLLAELLVKAGFKARLVQNQSAGGEPAMNVGPIAPQAEDLGAAAQKSVTVIAARLGLPVERVQQIRQQAGAQRDEFCERLWERTLSDMETVAELLDKAGIPAPPATTAKPESEHWWVRTSGGDLDPSTDAPPPKEGRTFELAELPPEAYHQVNVRMMIRQDQTDINVLQCSYRSADIFGQTITITNFPLDAASRLAGIDHPTGQNTFDVLTGTTKFQPVALLCGGDPDAAKVVTGKAFDLSGQQVDTGQGQVATAQRFGGGLGGVLGGGGNRQKPQTRLTSAWIEIELVAPGQPATVIRRDLLSSAAQLTARQKVLDLLATREVLLLPEEISDDYATTLALNYLNGWAAYLSQHSKSELGGAGLKNFHGRPQFNSSLYSFGVGRRSALGMLCDGRLGASNFTHIRPTAVSYVTQLIDGKSPAVSREIDILENTLVPVAGRGEPAQAGWHGNFGFALGILDTALEHEVLRGGESHQNASLALERSVLSGATPIVVKGALPAEVALGPAARAAIEPDLGRCAFVITPGSPASWYRIELDGGMTLGFVEGGGGQEASEYAEMVEVMNQMYEMMQFYGNLGRCLGAAISNPLVGENDWHENLADCFKGACGMITNAVSGLVGVETNWTNLIICKTVTELYDGLCDKLWDRLGE